MNLINSCKKWNVNFNLGFEKNINQAFENDVKEPQSIQQANKDKSLPFMKYAVASNTAVIG